LCGQKLATILAAAIFRSPAVIIQNREQMLDELQSSLIESAQSAILNIRKLLQSYFEKILKIEPHRLLADRKIPLNNTCSRMTEKISRIFTGAKIQLETQAGKLSACSPKSVLNRGYSITKNAATGRIVKSVAEININDIIITELKDENLVESRVVKK
jgi:exodeoxyribonuclease VII large subunit